MHTCRRGICVAAASTVSAEKAGTLAASLASSRASLSAAAARFDLHPQSRVSTSRLLMPYTR